MTVWEKLKSWGVKVTPWRSTDEKLDEEMDYPDAVKKPLLTGKGRTFFGFKVTWKF
jgi:hypothetical protein